MMNIRAGIAIVLFAVSGIALLSGQNAGQSAESFTALAAEEDFRNGVLAFHSGHFNEALVAFERAAASIPNQERVRRWIGRAYAQSGFWDAALAEWQEIRRAGEAGIALQQRMEILQDRMGLAQELAGDDRYVLAAQVSGFTADYSLFRRPTTVRPMPDGSNLIVSFAEHLIAIIDSNGNRRGALSGGITGLDGPYDVLPLPNGRFLVSEFAGDRVSILNERGDRVFSFGSSGMGEGQLLGPQCLALDPSEHVYVSDWGNRRIQKFSLAGDFLFSIGEPSGSFSGFGRPTGIVWWQDSLWVSDAERGTLEVFDASGNHLRTIRSDALSAPQSLAVYDSSRLLIADRNEVIVFNPQTAMYETIDDTAVAQVNSAAVDANGNILALDYAQESLAVFTAVSRLYSGLFVTIQRVYADDFPKVRMDVTVEDRFGQPVVGLNSLNFVISDTLGATQDLQAVYQSCYDPAIHTVVLLNPDRSMPEYAAAVGSRIDQLYSDRQEGDSFQLIAAAANPLLLASASEGGLTAAQRSRLFLQQTESGRIDTALRYSGTELLQRRGRRNIVVVSSGSPIPEFATYGTIELARFFQTNHISVSVLHFGPGPIDEKLSYLVEETGGIIHENSDPRGASVLNSHARASSSGWYTLEYTSLVDNDFGRRYLPVSVEAMILQRSGRDEMGYFSPLEFDIELEPLAESGS